MRPFILSLAATLALSATAALAQEGDACAAQPGAPVAGPEGATPRPLETPFSSVSATDAQGALKAAFVIETPGVVRLEAAPTAEGDPTIALHDATGMVVAEDDDSGGNLASRLEVQLQPGAYCLVVRNLAGAQADFALQFADQNTPALTQGQPAGVAPQACLPETQAEMVAETAIDAQLETGMALVRSAETAPFLRFTLETPQPMTITADNVAADPSIALFDANGLQVAQNDDFNGLNAQIDLSDPLPAGAYCLSVSALNDPTAPIEIGLKAFDEAAYFAALYDSGAASPPLGGDYEVTDLGPLTTSVSKDLRIAAAMKWLSFTLAEPSLVDIRALGLSQGMDARLVLHHADGRKVEENDDYADLNPRLGPVLAPGTYLLGVGSVSDGGGAARLSLKRYVEAQ